MVFKTWPWNFRQLFGGTLPTAYLTFDVETTGFYRHQDVIVEMGHCLIEDCKLKDRLNVVLDWTNHPTVSDYWLRKRLEETRVAMANTGKTYCMTYERMQKEGVRPPEKVLRFYYDMFAGLIEQRFMFAAHNGFFDEEMLANCLSRFGVADGFQFPDNLLFDTMAIEKGNQMLDHRDIKPRAGETMRTYFRRLKHLGGRGCTVKSSLDRHVVPKYDLAAKHGLDLTEAHKADFDAYLVHLLMEEFRIAAVWESVAPVVVVGQLPSLFSSSSVATCVSAENDRGELHTQTPTRVHRKPPDGTTASGTRFPERRRGQRNR